MKFILALTLVARAVAQEGGGEPADMKSEFQKWKEDSYLWAVGEDLYWQSVSPIYAGSMAIVTPAMNGYFLGNALATQAYQMKQDVRQRKLDRMIAEKADQTEIAQMESMLAAHRWNALAASILALGVVQQNIGDPNPAAPGMQQFGPSLALWKGFDEDVKTAEIGLTMMPPDAPEKDVYIANLFLEGSKGLRDQQMWSMIHDPASPAGTSNPLAQISNIRYMTALNKFAEATGILLDDALEAYEKSPKGIEDELELRIAQTSVESVQAERSLAIGRLLGIPADGALFGDFAAYAWGRKSQLTAKAEKLKAELATIRFQKQFKTSPFDLYQTEVDQGLERDYGLRRRNNEQMQRRQFRQQPRMQSPPLQLPQQFRPAMYQQEIQQQFGPIPPAQQQFRPMQQQFRPMQQPSGPMRQQPFGPMQFRP